MRHFLFHTNRDTTEGRVKRRSPRKAARQANYYSAADADGALNHDVERLLSRIESNAAPVLAKLRRGDFALTEDERAHLALFIGFFIIRVPSTRNFLEETMGKIGEVMMEVMARHPRGFERMVRQVPELRDITREEIEEARRAGLNPAEHFIIRGTPESSLSTGLRVATALALEIWRMRWEILMAEGGEHFITGDTPVTWRNPAARPLFGPGLGMPGTELSLPISPYLCLRGERRAGPGATKVGDDRVQDLNRERVRHAHRSLFADSAAAAEWAQKLYVNLRASGEAHARPFSFMILTPMGPRVVG
jgi:hypothetical protein